MGKKGFYPSLGTRALQLAQTQPAGRVGDSRMPTESGVIIQVQQIKPCHDVQSLWGDGLMNTIEIGPGFDVQRCPVFFQRWTRR